MSPVIAHFDPEIQATSKSNEYHIQIYKDEVRACETVVNETYVQQSTKIHINEWWKCQFFYSKNHFGLLLSYSNKMNVQQLIIWLNLKGL